MTIFDSVGHFKWMEKEIFWGHSFYYDVFGKYISTTTESNRKRIFKDIKRNKNFSVTS